MKYFFLLLFIISPSVFANSVPGDDDYADQYQYWTTWTGYGGTQTRTKGQMKTWLQTSALPYVTWDYFCQFSRDDPDWVMATYSNTDPPSYCSGKSVSAYLRDCSTNPNATFCGTDHMMPGPPSTDEQCLAKNDDLDLKLETDTILDAGLTWTGSDGCIYVIDSGVTPSMTEGIWVFSYSSTGADPDFTGGDIVEGPPEPYSGVNLIDGDITPTSDTSLDCPISNFTTTSGDTYCYSGPSAPQDSDYPDGSVRIDKNDGSYSIVQPDGTTTDYNSDGGFKSPTSAPTTADGTDYGDDAKGIIGAITGLKNAMKNGFDDIVDTFSSYMNDTVQSIADQGPTDENIQDVGTPEENLTQATNAIDGVKDELMSRVDGTDSQFASLYATMQGYWGAAFPTLPEPSCSPLTFAPGTPYSFTIECDVFDLIREALAWILYALTLYVIITTMFSARPS